jgi:hypothetical protein
MPSETTMLIWRMSAREPATPDRRVERVEAAVELQDEVAEGHLQRLGRRGERRCGFRRGVHHRQELGQERGHADHGARAVRIEGA